MPLQKDTDRRQHGVVRITRFSPYTLAVDIVGYIGRKDGPRHDHLNLDLSVRATRGKVTATNHHI